MGTMNPEQKHDTLWNGYKQEERHQEKWFSIVFSVHGKGDYMAAISRVSINSLWISFWFAIEMTQQLLDHLCIFF